MLVRLVMSCFWLLLGIINGVILANRVTPFTGPDLRNLSDGAKVVTKYLSKGTMILVVAACGIIGIFCMGLDQRTEISGENPLVSECAVDCSGNCTLYGSNNLALAKRVLSSYFVNIAFATRITAIRTVWQSPCLIREFQSRTAIPNSS